MLDAHPSFDPAEAAGPATPATATSRNAALACSQDAAPAPAHPAMGPDWRSRLRPGDIVVYRFPVAEGPTSSETPKARPCLVMEIETFGGRPWATIAYGTSARSKANRGYEVPVLRAADHTAAGLHRPTRFVGFRRLLVSLHSEAFVVHGATGSPVIGRLPEGPLNRLDRVRARIQAERDMRVTEVFETTRRRMLGLEPLPPLRVWIPLPGAGEGE